MASPIARHSSCRESPLELVTIWREAVAKQILTPAPDLAGITWKRTQLAGKCVDYLPIKTECIEQAIAEDVAFLAAHPTRRSNAQAVIQRREFKAAMRQRRCVSASGTWQRRAGFPRRTSSQL
jgi:hypothetical protein